MLGKNYKISYYLITLVFAVFSVIEIGIYLKMYTNLLGVIYLYINFFVFFLLFTISKNYSKANKKIRFSKIILASLLGIVSSFFISLLIPYMISYVDASFVFEEKIFIISKIMKPILYLFLLYTSFIECEFKIKLPRLKNQGLKN